MYRLVLMLLLCGVLGCTAQNKPLPPDEYYPSQNLAVVLPSQNLAPSPARNSAPPTPEASLPSYFTKPEGKDGLFTEEQLQLQEQYTKQQIEVKRRLQQLDGDYEPPSRSSNPYFQTPSPMFPDATTMQPTSPPKMK